MCVCLALRGAYTPTRPYKSCPPPPPSLSTDTNTHTNANRGAPEGGMPPELPPGGSAGMRTITMYRNGFTVDDGPFRCVQDS